MERFAEATAKSLNEQSGYLSAITDTDAVLSAYGQGKRSVVSKTISEALTEVLKSRRSYFASLAEGGKVIPIAAGEEENFTAQVIVPIVTGGDCLGAVILLSSEEGAVMDNAAVKLARLTADIIANQFE